MRLKFYIKEEKIKSAKRVIILTSKPEDGNEEKVYRTAGRLEDIAKSVGLETFVVFSEDAYLKQEKGTIKIYNVGKDKGFEIDPEDTIVINRGSVAGYLSSMDLVSQLEKMMFYCVNSRECIEDCADKYRTYLRLKEIGVETPRTALVRSEDGLDRAFNDVGGKFPVVLKTLKGSKGVGVFISESIANMKSVLQTVWKLAPEAEILIQEYIESDGDLRIHVLGNDVIAAMKRIKNKDDFRANYSLGGTVEPVKISPETGAIAIKANKAVKGIWTGVDVIKSKKTGQQYVIEVNSSPGTEGIEKATGKNVVKTVLDYAKDISNWLFKALECGYKEYIEVDGIGKVKAKFDTGNGAYCVIHADGNEEGVDFKVNGKTVTWKYHGKKMKTKFLRNEKMFVGGMRGYEEERPIIELEIVFNGKKYTEEFALDYREKRVPMLISRHFIRKLHLTIDPAKTYVLSIPPDQEEDKEKDKKKDKKKYEA